MSSASSSTFTGDAEQRRFGANGVDIIDEFCEASIFEEASKYLTRSKLKLTNEQKLTFYALFKQATIGRCNTPKPGLLSIYERTKWNAWNDLGTMNKDEAIMRYCNELEKVAPSWKQEIGGEIEEIKDDEEKENGASASGDSGMDNAMSNPQSRPVFEPEPSESDMLQKDKHIWYYTSQNNLEKVRECITKQQVNVNAKDEEGRTPLHWCVDRGHTDLARTLITEFRCDVNARDADGATPLHYAVMCEHLPLIELLLRHKADPFVEDNSGEVPANAIRSMSGVSSDLLQLLETTKEKSS